MASGMRSAGAGTVAAGYVESFLAIASAAGLATDSVDLPRPNTNWGAPDLGLLCCRRSSGVPGRMCWPAIADTGPERASGDGSATHPGPIELPLRATVRRFQVT